METQLTEELAQIGKFLRGGPVVDAIQRGQLAAFQQLRRADVGAQHALFDETVSIGTFARHNLLDLALGIKQDTRFDRLEVERAALLASVQQRLEEIVEPVHVLDHGRETLPYRTVRFGSVSLPWARDRERKRRN